MFKTLSLKLALTNHTSTEALAQEQSIENTKAQHPKLLKSLAPEPAHSSYT